MRNMGKCFPYLSKPYQLTIDVYRNNSLIYLGQDVLQMFLAQIFEIDTIVHKDWHKMYYDPKEYENLVSYFSSPIFNAFIMMENF